MSHTIPPMPEMPRDASKEKRACINQASQVHSLAIIPAKSCGQCIRRGDICWATPQNFPGIGRRCGMCILRHYQCDLKRGKEGKLRAAIPSSGRQVPVRRRSSVTQSVDVKQESVPQIVLPTPLKTPRPTQAAKRASTSNKAARKVIEMDVEAGSQSEPPPKRSRRSVPVQTASRRGDVSGTPDTIELAPSPPRRVRPSRPNDHVLTLVAPRIPEGPGAGSDLGERTIYEIEVKRLERIAANNEKKTKDLEETVKELRKVVHTKDFRANDGGRTKTLLLQWEKMVEERDRQIRKLESQVRKLDTVCKLASTEMFRASPIEYIYQINEERNRFETQVTKLEEQAVKSAKEQNPRVIAALGDAYEILKAYAEESDDEAQGFMEEFGSLCEKCCPS